MATFTLTSKAKSDMLSIGRYTHEKWGKAQRNKYLGVLDKTFHDLADNPDIGRKCDDIRLGYRKYSIGKHMIFYRCKTKQSIEIIRVLHNAMDIDQHIGD